MSEAPDYMSVTPPGNTAAVQAALRAAWDFGYDMWFRERCKDAAWRELRPKIEHAMLSPLRNCDSESEKNAIEFVKEAIVNHGMWESYVPALVTAVVKILYSPKGKPLDSIFKELGVP